MTYEQTILTIKNFLQSSESLQTFGGHVEEFNNIIHMIENHVEQSNKSETVIATQEDIKNVKNSITIIKLYLLEIPITTGITDFITSYGNLIINWVNNCAKQEQNIILEIEFINRFVQYHFTCKEVIEIIPVMLQKLQSFKNINLPSIDLARHYLGTLEKIREE